MEITLEQFDHAGTSVIVSRLGTYPVEARDARCIEIKLGGGARNGVNYYNGVFVIARGLRGEMCAWSHRLDEEITCWQPLVDAACEYLDDAVSVLADVDATFEAAEKRVTEALAYKSAFTTREDYERACNALGVPALTDAECDSYGVRYGDYRYPMYAADHIVKMHLAALRLRALEDAKPEPTLAAPAAPRMNGQLWEPCPNCGNEPVYMPLHVCADCWPA